MGEHARQIAALEEDVERLRRLLDEVESRYNVAWVTWNLVGRGEGEEFSYLLEAYQQRGEIAGQWIRAHDLLESEKKALAKRQK